MGSRPLRQHYNTDRAFVLDDDLGSFVEPWVRHRTRFLEALGSLSDAQWKSTTRCDQWDAKDVLSHLITADAFWVMSIVGAKSGSPTSFLTGFDPSTTPEVLVDPMRNLPWDDVLEQFRAGTESFISTVEGLSPEDWHAPAESPFGHLSVRIIFTHAFWDSWLHERDILVPLGLAPAVELDELLASAAMVLFLGGVQGGVLDDPEAVGPGPDAAIDTTLVFDELPAEPIRLQVGRDVQVSRGDTAAALSAGSALALVEGLTGRVPAGGYPGLPADLVAQLQRGAQIL